VFQPVTIFTRTPDWWSPHHWRSSAVHVP